MKLRSLGLILFGSGLFLGGACLVSNSRTQAAGPMFLYWAGPHVKTGSVATCFGFAKDAMREQRAQNVRVSPNEVAGTIGGAYAAITCIGTLPEATAVVMVVGTNQTETMQVKDGLAN